MAVYATTRHFRHNLEGREFYVNTDHKPLTYAMNSRTERPSLRQTRHLAFIAEFTTDIRYVKGKTNFLADDLSGPTVTAIEYDAAINIRAETVADAFFDGSVARFGTPATITTVIGAQFEYRLWDTLCNQFGITKNQTTSYHPQSNGMVDGFHRQLKAAIMAHETPNTWTTTLQVFLLGIRSAVKETLGRSAAKMT